MGPDGVGEGRARAQRAKTKRACVPGGKTGAICYHSDEVVGAARFELATSCSQNMRANQTALRPDTMAF